MELRRRSICTLMVITHGKRTVSTVNGEFVQCPGDYNYHQSTFLTRLIPARDFDIKFLTIEVVRLDCIMYPPQTYARLIN